MPEVAMPRLSDTMTEGVLARWLMSEGDDVHVGDILAEIETDKATMDLEAYEAGPLTKILVEAGATVPIGQTLAIIGEASEGGAAASEPAEPKAEDAAQPTEPKADESSSGAPSDAGPGRAAAPDAAASQPTGRVRATPLVRALAREQGIDLTTITGSGPSGRIVRADLQAAGRQAPAAETPAGAPAAPSAPQPVAAPAPVEGDEKTPLTSMRRITAERLTQSEAAPHFYLTVVVDAANLLDFRRQLNAQLESDGVRVSVNDLLVKACSVVLRAHPEVNTFWGGDHLLTRANVNVGIAVAIDQGLIVPVIRDADRKTVREISAEARALGERARAGRLTPDEFSGGTFTISNLGMFGISEFTAVINPPESAILAVGAAVETPVVKDGELAVTTTMRMTLTVDHRVLDGAVAAAFLRDLVQVLEEPLRIVT
ncbi:MAG: 2-oxo acid dehydrogenase subunit E2 [Intrasporangium sp.]|uniref:dihydrolipoamide acetyltransferase family protein n=1 Tax=Intrasporangium sp. TaxID=1925024 RepID=UPI0026480BEC|nr:dihydrolipoamide acetyltransferase family protein [Intrasporangium sp.]MDN5796257.1 2-oxo acid dehydrogenase subunit E2 [Intrasporangium sp.]